MTDSAPVVSLDAVTVRYGAHTALRDVSFEVPAGELVALIGPNGAGKSTLLKMIGGIYRPSEGSISTEGRVASLIELGAGFHPDMTGRENIAIISSHFAGMRTEVFRAFSRARIRNGSTEILATLITSDDPAMIAPDEIGLAEPALRRFGKQIPLELTLVNIQINC